MKNKDWLKKLFHRKKKAFTLIELLAIIVILAIIAVITVPIILNIIENAKKGAATNSAYGYKDAIQKFYASKLTRDSDYDIPDGLHTKQDFDNMGVKVNGKQPASNSFLRTYKNVVTSGCLQFDEYKVEFVDGKVIGAVKGECKTVNVIYTDVNENGKIDLADTVQIESDLFYIIDEPFEGKVKLLPQYNLDENSRQSSSSSLEIHYGASDYWNGHLSNYPMDIYDTYYIYEKTSRNNIYSYAENYKEYLIGLGAYFVTDARSMSFMEAKKMGCKTHDESNYNRSCPSFAYNQDQGYWLGSAASTNWVYFIEDGNNGGYLYPNLNSASWGVRPLIEIYESAITNNYTLTFDSRGGTEVASKTIVTGEKAGTLPTNPTKEGAVFEGWYTDKDYTSEKLTSETIPVGSTTYYARYVLSKAEYTDSDGSGTINTGDSVKILDDYFYVITAPSNNKVKLLPKYNLNYSSRQENRHNPSVAFSGSTYWRNSSYGKDSNNIYYAYRDNNNQDTSNNMKDYINAYKNYLISQGAEFVTDARLLSYEESRYLGCKTWSEDNYKGSCLSFAYNQGYWLGSADDWIYFIESGNNGGYLYMNPNSSTHGIRPLVEINLSALQ